MKLRFPPLKRGVTNERPREKKDGPLPKYSKIGVEYAPRLSREKIFPIFRPIFLRTRVPPCVFSKNRQKSSKIAILKPLAKTLGPTNLKISRGSVFFVQGYTKQRGPWYDFRLL